MISGPFKRKYRGIEYTQTVCTQYIRLLHHVGGNKVEYIEFNKRDKRLLKHDVHIMDANLTNFPYEGIRIKCIYT